MLESLNKTRTGEVLGLISKGPWYEIHKRFSDFEKLVNDMKKENPKLFLPSLPQKIFSANLSLYDENFIAKRKLKLEKFLNKMLSNVHIIRSKSIKLFLQQVRVFRE